MYFSDKTNVKIQYNEMAFGTLHFDDAKHEQWI